MQQQLAKEMKLVAALKQHYERYHAEDSAALKELYEYHAENCVRAAELTDDPRRCEEYLKLARAWTEAAITIRELMVTRKRMATRNPRKRRKPLDLLRSQETYEDLEKLREARARQ